MKCGINERLTAVGLGCVGFYVYFIHGLLPLSVCVIFVLLMLISVFLVRR